MNKDGILQQLQLDLSSADGAHAEVMGRMDESNDIYYARNYVKTHTTPTGTTVDRSGFKLKDIKRAVEGSLPDLTEPFLSTDEIVKITPSSGDSKDIAEAAQQIINRQFSKMRNKIEFTETIARDVQIDGTAFCKVGWSNDQPIVENIMANELMLDPSARSMKDLRFAIQRRKVMFQDIVSNPEWFGEHSDMELSVLEAATEDEYDRSRDGEIGKDDSYNFDDRPRQLIEVFEYYGVLDIGNGLEPVLCIWSDDTLLRATPSPYPPEWNGIPFEAAVYNRIPYAIYGEGLPVLLEDYQKLRNTMMQGVVDNMSMATNGQKFIRKGGMDQLNFRRMLSGEKYIYMNESPDDVMSEGTYNEIPASIFGLMEQLKGEQEELSGIGRLNSGLDPRALNSGTSATAANLVQTNSQKRLLQVTRHISEMLERVFYKWVDLNKALLQSGLFQQGNESFDISGDMLDIPLDVTIQAGTAGKNSENILAINTMIQQIMPIAGQLPPATIPALLSDMASLLKLPALSEVLATAGAEAEQQQGPDPMQQMAMQLDMAAQQADIAKTHSEAKKNNADAMETFVDTERASYGLQ